jgi:hypothetical protein
MFKTVEIREDLPDQITSSIPDREILPGQDVAVESLIRESCMFDATQKKLPLQVAVPNINWNPVIDRMHRSMPYEVNVSWQRRVRKQYGIPRTRRK